jgi:hypothetical protein
MQKTRTVEGQLATPAIALHERMPKRLLELAKMLGHRGLRNAKALGSLDELPCINDGYKGPDLLKIQHVVSVLSMPVCSFSADEEPVG